VGAHQVTGWARQALLLVGVEAAYVQHEAIVLAVDVVTLRSWVRDAWTACGAVTP
jgi:hypothetical protein